MQITVITLFPEVFTYLDASIIKRAREKGLLSIDFVNPRDFTQDRHRTVDDIPYGGGPGMVIKPEPVFDAVEYVREKMRNRGPLIIADPGGRPFSQKIAEKLAEEKGLVFLSGHYEGFDRRIYSLADMEISIGDYVLTGGELPVMVMIDAVARMIPGVIQQESARSESFQGNLLDHPHYTRPPVFRDMPVPEVLLSGHHKMINQWRRKEALKATLLQRPDLLKNAELSKEDRKMLKELQGPEDRLPEVL